jgi:hypothetical protein
MSDDNRFENLNSRIQNLESQNLSLSAYVSGIRTKIEAFDSWKDQSSITIYQLKKWYDEQYDALWPKKVSDFRNDPDVQEWAKRT